MATSERSALLSSATAEEERTREQQQEQLAVTPLRYAMLASFCMLSGTNAMQYIGFSTIVNEVKSFYGASVVEVNLLITIFAIMFIAATPITAVFTSRFGLRMTMLLGAILNLVATIIKLVSALQVHSYWCLFIGQVFSALPIVCILPIPPLLAAEWFPDSARTLATTTCSVCDNIGIALGMLISPLLVNDGGSSNSFARLFAVQMALAVVPVVGAVALPNRPPCGPPSVSAKLKWELEEERRSPQSSPTVENVGDYVADEAMSFVDEALQECRHLFNECKTCVKSVSTSLLSISAGATIGIGWATMALLAQLLEPFSFTSETCGIIGFVSISVGAVVSIGVGTLVDKKRLYHGPLLILLSLMVLGYLVIVCVLMFNADSIDGATGKVALNSSLHAVLFACFLVVALAQFCVPSIGFEFVAETSFPQDPAIAATLLMVVANLVVGTLSIVVPPLLLNPSGPNKAIPPENGAIATIILGAVGLIALFLALVAKPVLKRKLAEEREKDVSPLA